MKRSRKFSKDRARSKVATQRQSQGSPSKSGQRQGDTAAGPTCYHSGKEIGKVSTTVNCFKFEKMPLCLETFEDKEFVYIGLLSQAGGETRIRCDFSKSMTGMSSVNMGGTG